MELAACDSLAQEIRLIPTATSTITPSSTFSIHPNPADDYLLFESSSRHELIIECWTMLGQLQNSYFLGTQNVIQLTTTEWPAGMYRLVIKTKSGEVLGEHSVLKN